MSRKSPSEDSEAEQDRAWVQGKQLAYRGEIGESLIQYRDAGERFETELARCALESEAFAVASRWRGFHEEWAFLLASQDQLLEASEVLESAKNRALADNYVYSYIRSRIDASSVIALAIEELEQTVRKERHRFRFGGSDDLSDLAAVSGPVRERLSMALVGTDRGYVGLLAFARGEAIETVVRHSGPLLYVALSHFGLLAILIREVADGQLSFTSRLWLTDRQKLDGLISILSDDNAIVMARTDRVLSGINHLVSSDASPDAWQSLLRHIQYVLGVVGEEVSEPVAEFLHENDIHEFGLVLFGDLVLTPPYLAPFRAGDKVVTFVDIFDFHLIPSAMLVAPHSAAVDDEEAERAEEAGAGVFVGGADVWAGERIALRRFAAASSIGIIETNDPEDAVRYGRYARLLHLACHGSWIPHDMLRSSLVSGGETIYDVWMLLDTRQFIGEPLVIAASCNSALEGNYFSFNESVSLASAILMSGASHVIGSLWPADDVATSIILTMIYDEISECHWPWQALCRAQRRLRGMSVDQLLDWCMSQESLRILCEGGGTQVRSMYDLLDSESRIQLASRLNDNSDVLSGDNIRKSAGLEHDYLRWWFWAGFVCVG
jgi:hypothetical protein